MAKQYDTPDGLPPFRLIRGTHGPLMLFNLLKGEA